MEEQKKAEQQIADSLQILSNEVLAENREEIKAILKNSICKGIEQRIVKAWNSPLDNALSKSLVVQIDALFEDDDLKNIVKENKSVIVNGIKNGFSAISLRMATLLYDIFVKKTESSWERDSFFKELFEKKD